jgi:hypothetical protein
MRIDFGLYGERGGAHELLGTSLLDDSVAIKIRGKSDRPPYAPPGHALKPYVSGFAEENFYVFMKTFPHPAAARPGMVLSLALFMDLNELCAMANISQILALLPLQPDNECRTSVELSIQQEELQEITLPRPLAEALVISSPKPSVVWLGDDFEQQIAPLWRALWPETRRSFSFRLAFDPQDLVLDKPTVVTVPETLESRWSDFVVVQQLNKSLKSLAGDTLVGEEQGHAVRALRTSLNLTISHPKEITPLAKLSQTIAKEILTTDEARSALHTIARLCPDPGVGRLEKEQLLIRAVSAIERENLPAQIRAFRNVTLSAFCDAEPLPEAIRNWVAVHGIDLADGGILQAAFDVQNPLATRFLGGLEEALTRANPVKVQATISSWLSMLPAATASILRMVFRVGVDDLIMAQMTISLSPSDLEALERDGSFRAFTLTRISVFAASLPLKSAVESLQPWNFQPNSAELRTLLSKLESKLLLDTALIGSEPWLRFAGLFLAEQSDLVETLDFTKTTWTSALTYGLDAGLRVNDLSNDILSRVLDALLGNEVDHLHLQKLWKLLYERDVQLLEREGRAECWSRIPQPFRDRFMTRTAEAWIAEATERVQTPIPELELERAVMDVVRTRPLTALAILNLVRIFSTFDQALFRVLLSNRSRNTPMARVTAEMLGEIVHERGWRHAAEGIYGRAEYDEELIPLLGRCYSLLGRLQRLRTKWLVLGSQTTPTDDELWTSIEELAVELYQWGPGEHNVWERAGGDTSLIKSSANGSESWHGVLTYARNGGGGYVSLKSMCEAMLREFYWNDVLQRLHSYARQR